MAETLIHRKEVMMDVGQIAGLIAAIAFAILAGFMIYPLIRLGKLFDQLATTVKDAGDHTIPALDEGVSTVKKVNQSLDDANTMTGALSTTTNNVTALTDLYGSILGKPIIKVAAAVYAAKQTVMDFLDSKRGKKKPGREENANSPAGVHAGTDKNYSQKA